MTPPRSAYAHANCNITINSYEQEIIWVNADRFCDTVHITSAGKSKVTESITTKQNNKIPVVIINPTNVPRTVRKGDIIATVSPDEIIAEIKNSADWDNFMSRESQQPELIHSNHTTHSNSIKWRPSEHVKFNNPLLSNSQKQQLRDLIDEFYMVFSRNDEDIGRLDKKYGVHDIKLVEETPIKQRPYKTPYAKECIINESVRKMQTMKVVEPTDSNWASPIVLVKKPDGSERFCVDYRRLNAITIKDRYPMPNIESKLNKLHGCKYFTSLDCTSGYWQIQVSERAKNLIAFATNQGLFTFNYMPFGLCNAGATFQRVIEKVITGVDNTTAYIDDLLTYSTDFEHHLVHLKTLFERLKHANIKVKTAKCKIACNELMFLGYKISEEGISIDDSRTQAIRKYPKPTKAKHVKQFLGLAGFYRHFIKNFADIVEPLNRLTRKNVKFIWCAKCDEAFNTLIKLLSQKPILAYPNFKENFFLSTDASQVGIGAVLGQKDLSGRERAIHFASRSLNSAE